MRHPSSLEADELRGGCEGRSPLRYAGPVSDPIAEAIETVGATLDAVERALTRLREGTYRTCSTCGAPLDPEALGTDPLLEHCPAHAEPR